VGRSSVEEWRIASFFVSGRDSFVAEITVHDDFGFIFSLCSPGSCHPICRKGTGRSNSYSRGWGLSRSCNPASWLNEARPQVLGFTIRVAARAILSSEATCVFQGVEKSRYSTSCLLAEWRRRLQQESHAGERGLSVSECVRSRGYWRLVRWWQGRHGMVLYVNSVLDLRCVKHLTDLTPALKLVAASSSAQRQWLATTELALRRIKMSFS
jgi:hypothetical protein